jgi:hypothetical protein
MRRAGAALVVIVFVACSGGATGGPGPTSEPKDSLQTVVERIVPKDFTVVEEGTGPYDLAAAAALGADPGKERAALEQNGFLGAHVRLWRKGDTSIAILAYEFRTEAGAKGYELYSIDDARRTRGAASFEVSNVAGATGLSFVDRTRSPVSYLRAITFVLGPVRYGVTTGRPGTDPGSDVVVLLAETLEQLALRRPTP